MATFQVCQPTGWTGLVVAWVVVRSLAAFPEACPSGSDYLGGSCLPWRGRFVIGTARYVDNHGLPRCGWERTCGGVLLISDRKPSAVLRRGRLAVWSILLGVTVGQIDLGPSSRTGWGLCGRSCSMMPNAWTS